MHRLVLGEKATDIAKDMQMSDSAFSIIRNSPLFKAELERLTRQQTWNTIKTAEKVSDIVNAAAPIAARKMVDLMDSENENVVIKAAEKVIDYSDFGVDRDAERNKPITITQQQMVLIQEGMED